MRYVFGKGRVLKIVLLLLLSQNRPECTTAGLSDSVQWHIRGDRQVEEFGVQLSDIEPHSGQHNSTGSSFSSHSNLAAYGTPISSRQTEEEAPGCYSNLLYFWISPLRVSLPVNLSVHLCLDLSNTLPHATTHSQRPETCSYVLHIHLQTHWSLLDNLRKL